MKLSRLVGEIGPSRVIDFRECELTGLCYDSRVARPGELFAALPGQKADGATFAAEAVKNGACALLTEQECRLAAVPQLVVPQARAALSRAARAFFGFPARTLRLVGITGTNGKTTTAYLVRHILESCGVKAGMLGTVEYDLGSRRLPSPMTTPESVDTYRMLAEMREAKREAAVLEVSSHALCQHRVLPEDFAVAAFSNLTGDHLDYHKTMRAYREAKARLFRGLPGDALAVLNADDPVGFYYQKCHAGRSLTYGLRGRAQLRARILGLDSSGTEFVVEHGVRERRLRWSLVGSHNVQNALCAAGVALALGVELADILRGLGSFPGVPGRLEAVGPGQPFRVFVDYAHTDDGLSAVLRALRECRPARILCLFGCGGDRDRTKRPRMARAAEQLADLIFVTSDNPRTEDPKAIISEILAGFHCRERVVIEADRGQAIRQALAQAQPGDVVLLAGKGHENYQILGAQRVHFDDREVATAALAELAPPRGKARAA